MGGVAVEDEEVKMAWAGKIKYTLRQKQSAFALLVVHLIQFAYREGYEITLGEAYRPRETAELMAKKRKGIKNSLHCKRLALDLNLFKNGKYLTSSEAHKPLGEYWESLSTPGLKCCWGGRFGDGNHYSIAHGGRK